MEAKCLAVNPRDNNYLAVGANGPFVRLYDIRMIHNYRFDCLLCLILLYGCDFRCKRFNFFYFSYRKSMSQNTSAAVHILAGIKKPIPDGAGQYYVAGEYLAS